MSISNGKANTGRMGVFLKCAAVMLLVLSLSAVLMLTLNGTGASAAGTTTLRSGECTWTLDENGVMTIEPTNGESGLLDNAFFVNEWSWHPFRSQVREVIVKPGVICNKEAAWMFQDMTNCTSFDISGLDFSVTEDIHGMFKGCTRITELDLSEVEICGGRKYSAQMFSGCTKLKNLNLGDFDCTGLTSLDGFFYDCDGLTELDLSGWDTSAVNDMADMFYSCSNLAKLDITGWDTSNVSDMSGMFSNCISLTELDVSGFDTQNVTDMGSMFLYNELLTELDVSGFDTSKVTNMYRMFRYCSGLTELDVSGWNTQNVKDMIGMFEWCNKLEKLDLSGWDTSAVNDMQYMFNYCQSLAELKLSSSFNTANVTNMRYMFCNCHALEELDLSGFDTAKVTNMDQIFYGCDVLKGFEVSARWVPGSNYRRAGWYNYFNVVDGTLQYLPGGSFVMKSVTIHDGDNDITVDLKENPESFSDFTGDKTATLKFIAIEDASFTITWLNHDGTVLKVDTVKGYEMPVYTGETPVKEATDDYIYTHVGWVPSVESARADATYTAWFYEEANYDISLKINGAAAKLYEPWGIKFFASFEGEDVDKMSEYGIVVIKDEYYNEYLTDEELLYSWDSYMFNSWRDNLGYEAPSEKYPNGRYTALLEEGIYSYDIEADYYAMPYAMMEDGRYFFGERRCVSMEDVINSNKTSPATSAEEKVVCQSILDLRDSVAQYYAATGIQGAVPGIDVSRGSDQNAAEKVMTPTESGLNPAVKGAASRLIEPWGLKFTAAYPDDSRIVDYGIVMLRENFYSESYADDQEAMRMNEESYVFTDREGTLQYVESNGRYSALLTEGINSKDIAVRYYAAPFVVLEDGTYVYGTVRNTSMFNILTTNLNSVSVSAEEKAVCQDIIDLYNAVTAYYAVA